MKIFLLLCHVLLVLDFCCSFNEIFNKLIEMDNEIINLLKNPPICDGEILIENIVWYKEEMKKIIQDIIHHEKSCVETANLYYNSGGPKFSTTIIDNKRLKINFEWHRQHLFHLHVLIEEVGKLWKKFLMQYKLLKDIYKI